MAESSSASAARRQLPEPTRSPAVSSKLHRREDVRPHRRGGPFPRHRRRHIRGLREALRLHLGDLRSAIADREKLLDGRREVDRGRELGPFPGARVRGRATRLTVIGVSRNLV